jgi:ABC-2 type transport system permease protein
MMAYYDLVARRMQRFTAQRDINQTQEIQQINRSYRYNPAVYTQSLLNSVAHTDIADYAYFRQQTALFRQHWKSFLYSYHFNDKKFGPDDYRLLPVYHPSYRPDNRRLQIQGSCYLLLLASGLLLTGTLLLRQNHTRHRI